MSPAAARVHPRLDRRVLIGNPKRRRLAPSTEENEEPRTGFPPVLSHGSPSLANQDHLAELVE